MKGHPKFRWTGFLAFFALFVLFLSACGPQQAAQTVQRGEGPQPAAVAPQRGGTLRIAFEAETGGLDPHTTVGRILRVYGRFIWNTLTHPDASGKIVPELAESWSTPDPRMYVFKLRKGVKFHDGTDFNAAAVKFNIDRAMSPEATDSARQFLLGGGLTSVEVVDDYTVKFNLKFPNAAFPAYLSDGATAAMVSPTAVKKWGDQFLLHPVGTGPFELVEWVRDDHKTLKRFDGYWRKDEKGVPLPYVDEVIIRPIPDGTVRFNALRNGEVDLIDSLDPANLATLNADKNLKGEAWGSTSFFVALNCSKPPFDNKALRQAVAWAVDREALHKTIFGGTGAVAQGPLARESWAFDPQGGFYTRDIAKAKEKLAEGGKPNGFKFEAINYRASQEMLAAQAVQGQLAEIGIDMEIVPLEDREASARRLSGNFIGAFTKIGNAADPDLKLYREYHTGGQLNLAKCANPELDQSLEKGQQELDQAKRKEIYARVQASVMDDSWWIFLHQNAAITAMRSNVQGFVPSIEFEWLQYDWLWLQK